MVTTPDTSGLLGELIARNGTRLTVDPGHMLFREGDESTAVYGVLRGRVKLFVSTPCGRELVLGVKGPNQAFGDLSAIGARPRSASAQVTDRSVLAVLQGDAYMELLQSAPALAVAALRELADQLRRSNARLAARDTENTTVRVGHVLLELTEKFVRHSGPGVVTTLPITHDELAGWIGASREAASRALATYRKAGLIETGRNRIVILDVGALTETTRGLSAAEPSRTIPARTA